MPWLAYLTQEKYIIFVLFNWHLPQSSDALVAFNTLAITLAYLIERDVCMLIDLI